MATASPDLDAIKAQLVERDGAWAEHARRGEDVDAIVSYWSDDARVIAPGWPLLVGHEAIRGFVESMLSDPSRSFTWGSDLVEVSTDGRLAWLQGPNYVYTREADGTVRSEQGRGLTVWRRGDDDVWLCIADIWNSEES